MLAGTVSMLSTLPARAEPPSASPAEPSSAADERAFEADAARYERLLEFTQKLVREREQRAFEEATERYDRLAKLTQRLTAAAAADAEREFDAEVALYVRKRELTRELSVRNANGRSAGEKQASPVASQPTSFAAPVW